VVNLGKSAREPNVVQDAEGSPELQAGSRKISAIDHDYPDQHYFDSERSTQISAGRVCPSSANE
jgi:hypothetical protein